MVGFFRNMFQQSGFSPTETSSCSCWRTAASTSAAAPATSATTRSRGSCRTCRTASRCTAWQLVKEGRPFTETLTTNRFRMTTALKSLYVQIEMPNDTNQRSTSTTVLHWNVDFSGNPIPIEQALTNMTSATRPPPHAGDAPAATAAAAPGRVRHYLGTSVLFQRPARVHQAAARRQQHDDLQRPRVEALLHGAGPVTTGPG
jgi:hypothetical protein